MGFIWCRGGLWSDRDEGGAVEDAAEVCHDQGVGGGRGDANVVVLVESRSRRSKVEGRDHRSSS